MASGATERADQAAPADEGRPDGSADRGTRVYWLAAAVVLSLICAALIGVNLARWAERREAGSTAPSPTAFTVGTNMEDFTPVHGSDG